MRKFYLLFLPALLCLGLLLNYHLKKDPNVITASTEAESEEEEGYDGPWERDSLEFEKTKDPFLGYVPVTRLGEAMEYTEDLKATERRARMATPLSWTERGPIYDSLGPSNGNTRAGVNYTSGRIAAVLVDTLNDPTGNTVFAGGIAGGLWKCTNMLSSVPNWQPINDRFSNMALSSICQDPTNPQVMYFATGEATSNADAVYGKGVWKSVDGGATWKQLPSTSQYLRNFKIMCDNAGNVYLATRSLGSPIEQPYGLFRSNNGGSSWTNITPANLTSNTICTDIEISSTGKLHASFGYLGTVVNHFFTNDPASVSPTSGWTKGSGIRLSGLAAVRMEIAALADTLYAVTVNSGNNVDSCYKSIDGGSTWTKQNTIIYTSGLGSAQGWYSLTLGINPLKSTEIMIGGLDAYRSTNSGQTITRQTFWVTSAPYVHADHHWMQWYTAGNENRILIASDGGLFLSRDNGVTFADKNRNLAIKQFYAADLHPDAGSNYVIAGAQDNGTHQLKYPGLASSIEVTGGDGAYVHINQKNPLVQFGAYVFNQYRRSINGGQTWSQANFSTSAGLFINPFDVDDSKNMMYASWTANNIFRWPNANTSTSANLLAIPNMGTASAFKVSNTTPDRVFIGTNTGRLFRLDHADVASSASLTTDLKNISGPGFPAAGFLNCVNTGSSDDYLVAVFTNYGVNNVWYSKDGGANWSAIDGNLPDMPVRWAIFHPQYNNRLIIATETGVYSTDAVNGANTVWTADPGFPTVRTDMLKLRASDQMIVAATHGRGIFTAQLPLIQVPEIDFTTNSTTVTEQSVSNPDCRGYKDYTVEVGILYAPTNNATVQVSATGTATRGVDFDFTTNGDFNAPSDQLVFAAGETNKKTVTVRIYDDAEVEGTENFTLGLTITNTTDAGLGVVEKHVFTIGDNDRLPTPIPVVENFSIGTYNGDVVATSPFAANRIKHKMQSVYLASELQAAGMFKGGNIKSLALKVSTKNSTRPFTGLTIAMANVTATNLSTGFAAGTYTTVWSGDYSTVPGENKFNFTTPFAWDGTSNVIVQFCFDNNAGPADGFADFVEGNSYPLGAGVRASTYSNFTSGTTAGCSLPAAFISDFRMNVNFGIDFGIVNPIATALNTQKTEYLNANNDIYYYGAAGELIARVRNLTGDNYGCTKVMIDRAGSGASKFWNSNKKDFLMDKTYRIFPSGNDASARYEVTFYYTKAEKEGWEKATGNSWNDIQLVKTSGPVSEVTASNAKPNNDGTVQAVVETVKGTYDGGYTLTAALKGSFGGFGAGLPGRQFTVLTVKANQGARTGDINNGIDVNWTTSSEAGSTYFDVEKSYDGENFHKIGTVTAAGNAAGNTNYNFTDRENVEINYYRVRMHHADGYELLSKSILIRNDKAVQQVFVLTNPFRDDIRVRFGKTPGQGAVLSLYDMQGKLVKRYNPKSGLDVVSFTVNTGLLTNGIYNLDVMVDGKHYSFKLLRN